MVGPLHVSSTPPTLFAVPDGFFDDAVFWTGDAKIDAIKADKPDFHIALPAAPAEKSSDGAVISDPEFSAVGGEPAAQSDEADSETGAGGGGGGKTCHTCGDVFDVLEEQRYHFKSDWHRFNVCTLNLCLQR